MNSPANSKPPQIPVEHLGIAVMPGLFVLLWSTGFIGAKFGLPYVEPFTFLLIRFLLVIALLIGFALITRAPWPRGRGPITHLAVTGLGVHGAYLGGVFYAIHTGLSAGIVALIVGLQPLVTASAAGFFLGDRVTGRQWMGLALGLVGLVLVVQDRIQPGSGGGEGVLACCLALVGITAGTLYQKRHGETMDLRTGPVVQFTAAAVVMAILASTFETMEVRWSGEFVFALLWLSIVLSLGAISLLLILIRRGAAAKVASLFYLTPPVTAVMAYLMFGEELTWIAMLGMLVAAVGVALVTMDSKKGSE